jgi:hypothetical protein
MPYGTFLRGNVEKPAMSSADQVYFRAVNIPNLKLLQLDH